MTYHIFVCFFIAGMIALDGVGKKKKTAYEFGGYAVIGGVVGQFFKNPDYSILFAFFLTIIYCWFFLYRKE